MKMGRWSRKSKLGVMVLLFVFLSVPVFSTGGIAQEKAASSAGGFGAAHASGGETTLAAGPVMVPPSPMDTNTALAFMMGLIALAALLAAAAAG